MTLGGDTLDYWGYPCSMRTWDVPGADPGNECWVGWSVKLDGFFLGTRTPEGDYFSTDAFASVPALMVATAPAVLWDQVPGSVLAELHEAPSLAYLEAEHTSAREKAVASALRLALAS